MSNTPHAQTESSPRFTKTETLRRLRAGAALMRQHDRGIAKNFRVEVGTRVEAVAFATVEEAAEYSRTTENDLENNWDFDSASRLPEVQAHGYIANIYVSSTGDWGELYDVQNVWLGTPDEEPVLMTRLHGLVRKEG